MIRWRLPPSGADHPPSRCGPRGVVPGCARLEPARAAYIRSSKGSWAAERGDGHVCSWERGEEGHGIH